MTQEPLALDNGATRKLIEDADTLTLRGHAKGPDTRVGFGAWTGRVRPARSKARQGSISGVCHAGNHSTQRQASLFDPRFPACRFRSGCTSSYRLER